jgi:putative sigma-54 modulation protein
MQIRISSQNVDVTEALHQYGEEKLARLSNHFDNITNAHLMFKKEDLRHIAEAELHVPGKQLFAKAEDKDMYSAIDALMDKLSRQIRDYKEQL